MTKIKQARIFAISRHKGQKRKDGKTPYWKHLEQVVKRLEMVNAKSSILITGWLHDTIEDTETDYDDIKAIFGKKIADDVSILTKDTRLVESKRERQYVKQLKSASIEAKIVKLADITANVADMKKSGYTYSKQKLLIKNKIKYLTAIKPGIYKKICLNPRISLIIEELNHTLSEYRIKYKF